MAKLKWTIEIQVEDIWVQDGFNLEGEEGEQEIVEMLQQRLPYAFGCELGAKILSAPDPKIIRFLQTGKQ